MTQASTKALSPAKKLLYINFDPRPRPLNIATLETTRNLAGPSSKHPFHIRTQRRLASFDPSKLHWRVLTPAGLSKSAYVRDKVGKRIKEAFKDELRRLGWSPDGRRLAVEGTGAEQERDLCGAALIGVVKDPIAITASMNEVRESVSQAVRKIVQEQRGEHESHRKRGR
ncbi:hypothetical protein B0A48_07538 [Cryoendolithus antarcticus]|uniref:Uncharacterized protein n=1 Tax=Cryoendolithus antarcticus TaxID=1507870 RepID=A0A1V8T708_9PEZI|nr:hypothetical protein B0A48_07538 [Cryoendolithus antarcticus]